MNKKITSLLAIALTVAAPSASAAWKQQYLYTPYTDPVTGQVYPSGTPAAISPRDWVIERDVGFIGNAGWVTLTRAVASDVGYIQSKQSFGRNTTIKVEFDYVAYNGTGSLGANGGDGLSIYLFSANSPNAGLLGGAGGALGYCQMQGAYVGIGLDENGNFARNCEKPVWDGSYMRDGITVRGSWATNYRRIQSVQFPSSLDLHRPTQALVTQAYAGTKVKHVIATFQPKGDLKGYKIDLQVDGQMLLDDADFWPFDQPTAVKVGIAASTGTLMNIHEIRYPSLEVKCVDADNYACNVPSYITGMWPQPVVNYPYLTDGDQRQIGWNGSGEWTSLITLPAAYGVDISGTACSDHFGECEQPPADVGGSAGINTVVVWSRPDSNYPNSSTFTEWGAIDFRIEAMLTTGQWITLAEVVGNNQVKRVVTFPTTKVAHLQVVVTRSGNNNVSPLTELELLWRQ